MCLRASQMVHLDVSAPSQITRGYSPSLVSTRLNHAPECEIDAATESRCGFRDLVKPEALGLACHYEPMPFSEFKRNHFLCSPMPKLEPPCRTERQARYGWAVSKTRLVVAMPSDAITA